MVRAVLICGVVFMLGCDGLEESNASGSNAEAQAVAGKGITEIRNKPPRLPRRSRPFWMRNTPGSWTERISVRPLDCTTTKTAMPIAHSLTPHAPLRPTKRKLPKKKMWTVVPRLPSASMGKSNIDTDQNGCPDTCVEAGVGCATNGDCEEGEYCHRPDGERACRSWRMYRDSGLRRVGLGHL